MKSRTFLALGLSGALAVSGMGLLASQSASAYTGSKDLSCRLYFGDSGTGSSGSTMSDTFTLTQTPSYSAVGSTVTVKFSGAKGARGGPLAVEAGTNKMVATLALSGAQSGTVVATTSSTYPATTIPGAPAPNPNFLGKYTATGSYKVTKAGTTTAALKLLKVDNTTEFNVDTYCADMPDADIKAAGGKVSPTIKQAKANGDLSKPVVKVKSPASKASKAKSISGTITDAGSGPKSVTVKVYEKAGGKWYSFNGKKMVKKSSKGKAISGAKSLTDSSVSSGKWSVTVKKLKKGKLYVQYSGKDKVGNTSAKKTYSKTLK